MNYQWYEQQQQSSGMDPFWAGFNGCIGVGCAVFGCLGLVGFLFILLVVMTTV